MPEITPSFNFQWERRMRVNQETEYARRLADENTWWNKLARPVTLEGKTEIISWLLETAMIEPVGPTGTGKMDFENLASLTTEITTYRHGKGIQIQRDQLEDLDGTGLGEAAAWAAQVGSDSAYYPQRLMAQLILNGAATDGSATSYDGVPFFADNTANTVNGVSVNGHPFNFWRPSLGGYQNWLKGAASGAYPGALPIDESVTAEVALQNLAKLVAHIKANKMANGVDPRFLKIVGILHPPKLAPRIAQLLDAKFIAQTAGSGAGSADVIAQIAKLGMGQAWEAQELAAAFTYNWQQPFVTSGVVKSAAVTGTGSDTTYYVITESSRTTQLGSLLHCVRKPFRVSYYTGEGGGGPDQAQLDRMNYFEYHVQGRQAAQYGHPFGIYRVDAS